ncbi:MAG: ribosome assembly cofactor RimP [Bacteroidales bacterium]|nr:ribosome assembly cofactor RimP [Bacteroidales bacterium]
MINNQKIQDLIEQKTEGTDLFLVSLTISPSNAIRVVVDSDSAVSIDKCISISRHIENHLNRDEEDFSLEVTSFGLGEPLVMLRQYEKNLNRNLKITTVDGKVLSGQLLEVFPDKIVLNRTLTKKEIKEKVDPLVQIEIKQIKESKVEISFK